LLPSLFSLSVAQFSSFSTFPGSTQFPSTDQRFTNPGQLEFSNFVDLPSQRLRQPARLTPELPPGCALLLNTGACISYQDVNAAFTQAVQSLPFQPLKFPNIGDFSNEELGNLGTVIHETTRIIAKAYSLEPSTVFDVVNKIDTAKTVIAEYCPRYLLNRRCEVRRYRDVEGICNNLQNPHWGASMIAHSRFLPVSYPDGISAPRISVTGRQLPSARLVSAHVHRDEGFHDHALTFLFVAWGQFTDHDITLTSEIDEVIEEDLNCCSGISSLLCSVKI
jgi:hypothetical protein